MPAGDLGDRWLGDRWDLVGRDTLAAHHDLLVDGPDRLGDLLASGVTWSSCR